MSAEMAVHHVRYYGIWQPGVSLAVQFGNSACYVPENCTGSEPVVKHFEADGKTFVKVVSCGSSARLRRTITGLLEEHPLKERER